MTSYRKVRRAAWIVPWIMWAMLLLTACCLPAYPLGDDVHPPVNPHHVQGSSLGAPVDLSSTWLIRQGDDPRYADPGLDDSGWLLVKSGEPLSTYGLKNVDLVWYRTHVTIPPGEHNLALSLSRFSGSYQIFVNGVLVGASRAFPPGGVNLSSSNRRYPIPDALVASGQVTIAVRGAIGRISEHGVDPAGFAEDTALLLGTEPVLADGSALWFFRDATSNITNLTFQFLVLMIALALALTLRSEREYLALVIFIGADCANGAIQLWTVNANIQPGDALQLLELSLDVAYSIAALEFVRLVLGLRRTRWLAVYEWLLAGFVLVVVFWARHLIYRSASGLSHSTIVLLNFVNQVIFLPAHAGLPVVALWAWWKRRQPVALLLLVPLLLSAAVSYVGFGLYVLFQLHLIATPYLRNVPIDALDVGWDEVSTLAFTVALLVFLVLRTLSIARERARISSELEAAQTVQQVLLARASQPTPGFTVESVYYPASEVGGDFFLVSSGPDGSLVAIVGDVSGKGLIAAMRVSMILGVLRREDSREPEVILNQLNEALLTQGEMGFTTACCVRLDQGGHYTLANAGHISPYSDGLEIATPPGLPLGLSSGSQYEIVSGSLAKGHKLVLMSDGVVEARSRTGELYGFDRLPGLTRMPAVDIADIAQRFGQEDDITVLTIACCVYNSHTP
jgi:hypothetical protein